MPHDPGQPFHRRLALDVAARHNGNRWNNANLAIHVIAGLVS